jgi:hypothetical protein
MTILYFLFTSNSVKFEEENWSLNISKILSFAFGIWELEADTEAGTYLGLSQTLGEVCLPLCRGHLQCQK